VLTLGDLCAGHGAATLATLPDPAARALRVARAARGEAPPDDGRAVLVMHTDQTRVHAAAVGPADLTQALRAAAPAGAIVTCAGGAVVVDPEPACIEPALRGEFIVRLGEKLATVVGVRGIEGVTAAAVRAVRGCGEGGAMGGGFVIETSGGALSDAMALPGVDWRRATSNNVCEVCATLGIEAARVVLLRELVGTIGYDGTYINDRHPLMVADSMCQRGYVVPMSRHGINRGAGGGEVMKQCSYEETMEVLARAALNGDCDTMAGITACVAFGQPCSAMGTGASSALVGPQMMRGADRGARPGAAPRKRPRLMVSSMSRFGRSMDAGECLARRGGDAAARAAGAAPAAAGSRPSPPPRLAPAARARVPTATDARGGQSALAPAARTRAPVVAGAGYVPPSPEWRLQDRGGETALGKA